MSFIIDFLLDKWTVVLPTLIALISLLFGGQQKRKATAEKTKRKTAEMISDHQAQRAKVAEETTDYLIDRSDKSREEIKDEVVRSRTDRNHFSD
jgi:hypothetical protein